MGFGQRGRGRGGVHGDNNTGHEQRNGQGGVVAQKGGEEKGMGKLGRVKGRLDRMGEPGGGRRGVTEW